MHGTVHQANKCRWFWRPLETNQRHFVTNGIIISVRWRWPNTTGNKQRRGPPSTTPYPSTTSIYWLNSSHDTTTFASFQESRPPLRRLLLLNHSHTYFDVFATLPPIIPPSPIGIVGFGAGFAARLILETYPDDVVIHGWELDPSVISVAKEYFSLSKLDKQHPHRLFIYIGNAQKASIRDGFSGILVDLFSRGSLLPELEDPNTWVRLKKSLRKGGRIMVNVGGTCVESEENTSRNGKIVMEATLKAMKAVFGDQLFVLNLGNTKHDSSIALTGPLPDLDSWKKAMPRPLNRYVDMWKPFDG